MRRPRTKTPDSDPYYSRSAGLRFEGLCLGYLGLGLDFNRDDWIRTSDLFHPKEARYQAAPRPVHIEAYALSRSTVDASIRV